MAIILDAEKGVKRPEDEGVATELLQLLDEIAVAAADEMGAIF